MIADAAAELQRRGGQLSGSFLSVAPTRRQHAARELVAAGAYIHADVFDGTFPLKTGATPELILALSAQWPARLDVHLMAADPIRAVNDLEVSNPIARTTVHVRPGQPHGLRSALASKSNSFWLSVDTHDWMPEQLRERIADDRPDGVTVMLAPPGVPHRRADYRILDSSQWAAVREFGAIGVDGGVTVDRIEQLMNAGVSYVVMGRSLFGNHSTEQPDTKVTHN
jgi:ribulose-phosphate 3-epimerase